mgnify:FL=1
MRKCAGCKQHTVKEWFAEYFLHTAGLTFDFTKDNKTIVHNKCTEPWKVNRHEHGSGHDDLHARWAALSDTPNAR